MRITSALLIVLLASPAFASGLTLPAFTMATAQSLDIASTCAAVHSGLGMESNRLMGSGCDAHALAMKAATTAGTLWLMQKLSSTHPKAAQVTLYALSGVIGAVAIHNARIRK